MRRYEIMRKFNVDSETSNHPKKIHLLNLSNFSGNAKWLIKISATRPLRPTPAGFGGTLHQHFEADLVCPWLGYNSVYLKWFPTYSLHSHDIYHIEVLDVAQCFAAYLGEHVLIQWYDFPSTRISPKNKSVVGTHIQLVQVWFWADSSVVGLDQNLLTPTQ